MIGGMRAERERRENGDKEGRKEKMMAGKKAGREKDKRAERESGECGRRGLSPPLRKNEKLKSEF